MRFRAVAMSVAFGLVAAAAPAVAQDPTPPSDEFWNALGTTAEAVEALEPNEAWDDLGLFSADALKVIEAATVDRPAATYAFGDDPNGTPLFVPDGGTPVGSGAMFWHVPEDWTRPPAGWGDTFAFAETGSSPLQTDEAFLLLWMEFDSDYDFASTRQVNEGFPLMIPGLPVWNSTFAGDTWEGANVIPNAIYDNGLPTFDVKRFEPPQSFPLIDVAAFYYRSGNIMAMGVSTDDLAALANHDVSASAATEGSNRTLLYTGDATDTSAHMESAVDEVLWEVYWYGWSHITENGQFTPGFIAYMLEMYGPLQTAIALSTAVTIFGPPPAPEPEPDPDPEPASTPADDDPRDEAEDEPAVDPGSTATTSEDGGSNTLLILLMIVAAVIIAIGLWVFLSTTRTRTGDGGNGDDEDGGDDDDPRDDPPPVLYGEEIEPEPPFCDWLLKVKHEGNPAGEVVREPAGSRCCYVTIDMVSKVESSSANIDRTDDFVDEVASAERITRWQVGQPATGEVYGDGDQPALVTRSAEYEQTRLSPGLGAVARSRFTHSMGELETELPHEWSPGGWHSRAWDDPTAGTPDFHAGPGSAVADAASAAGYPPRDTSDIEYTLAAHVTDETRVEIDAETFCPPDRRVYEVLAVAHSAIVYDIGSSCDHGPVINYCTSEFRTAAGGTTQVADGHENLSYEVDDVEFVQEGEGTSAGFEAEVEANIPFQQSLEKYGITATVRFRRAEGHNDDPEPISRRGQERGNYDDSFDVTFINAVTAVVDGIAERRDAQVMAETTARHTLTVDGSPDESMVHPGRPCRNDECKRIDCRCDPVWSLRFDPDQNWHAVLTVDGRRFFFLRPPIDEGTTRWRMFDEASAGHIFPIENV